jgi:hypothetical protein
MLPEMSRMYTIVVSLIGSPSPILASPSILTSTPRPASWKTCPSEGLLMEIEILVPPGKLSVSAKIELALSIGDIPTIAIAMIRKVVLVIENTKTIFDLNKAQNILTYEHIQN